MVKDGEDELNTVEEEVGEITAGLVVVVGLRVGLIIFIVLSWQFFCAGPVAGSCVGCSPEPSSVAPG